MIASMPFKAQWIEYPLISLAILEMLRQTERGNLTGNRLRQAVGMFACPEANDVYAATRYSDGNHPLSYRLRQELDTHYKQTAYGKRQEWEVPPNSGNYRAWGQWSTALLIDKLIAEGRECTWI